MTIIAWVLLVLLIVAVILAAWFLASATMLYKENLKLKEEVLLYKKEYIKAAIKST